MIWPYLAAMAAASMLFNLRCGSLMLICVLLTAWCASASFAFDVVVFAAIYTGIGALSFFVLGELIGAIVMCLIGALYVLQGIGYIPEYPRQIASEILFSLGVVAGAISGPSGGRASRAHMSSGGFRNRFVFGRSNAVAETAPKRIRALGNER